MSTYCVYGLNRFLMVKARVGTFNKEKALARAFSGHCETSQRFVEDVIDVSTYCQAAGSRFAGAAPRSSISSKLLKCRCSYNLKIARKVILFESSNSMKSLKSLS